MQQQIICFFSSEEHIHTDDLKFCSQDQVIILLNIINLMFFMANYQTTFFPPSQKSRSKQASSAWNISWMWIALWTKAA